MSPNLKKILIAAGVALALMAIAFIAGWNIRAGKCQELPSTDTIYIHHTDTVTVEEPRDTLIRVVYKPYAVHDTTTITHIVTDSFFITLPYEHRYYEKEDTLEIWYSGVDPKIDSAKMYITHITEIITKPYEVRKMPPLTWEIGAGTSIVSGKIGEATGLNLNPCGISRLNLHTKHTTWSAYGMIDTKGQWSAGAAVMYRLDVLH